MIYRTLLGNVKRSVPRSLAVGFKNHVRMRWHRHRSGQKRDILLFTSRRSGGTWLTEMISSSPGVQAVIEPHETGKEDPYFRDRLYSKKILKQSGIPLLSEDAEWMESFHRRLVLGEEKVQYAWNPFGPGFWNPSDRLCIKMHVAKPWIEWYGRVFPECQILVLWRHPVPQALSAHRVQSKFLTPIYLRDKTFVSENLNERQIRLALEIERQGSHFECFILDWCIKNILPLRKAEAHPEWVCITYEELLSEPDLVLDTLSSRLSLSRNHLAARIGVPSSTVRSVKTERMMGKSAKETSGNIKYLIERWRDVATSDQLNSAQRILDIFEVGLYHVKSGFPCISGI